MNATALVTGYPLDAAQRLARQLALGGDRVLLLARDKFLRDAEQFAKEVGATGGGAIEVIEGDILALDLGLSGAAVRQIHAEATEIHHLAAIHYLGVDVPRMRQVNVEGLREVLELALGIRHLRRVCVWSTVFVAGDRRGTVHEDELRAGQVFRNAYERTKAEAEQLARSAMPKLPLTVVRVPILVGDSRTSEAGRRDAVYTLAGHIVDSPTAVALPVMGDHLLHIAPIDFAVRASVWLARNETAVGGTFHLVDDDPPTARAFFDAVADAAGRPRPVVNWASHARQLLRKVPAISAQSRHDRSQLAWFDCDVRFDSRRSRALLQGSGIGCPPFSAYVDSLVAWLREREPV
jgi:nucleoside-diphosphate-sugar epimerase